MASPGQQSDRLCRDPVRVCVSEDPQLPLRVALHRHYHLRERGQRSGLRTFSACGFLRCLEATVLRLADAGGALVGGRDLVYFRRPKGLGETTQPRPTLAWRARSWAQAPGNHTRDKAEGVATIEQATPSSRRTLTCRGLALS